MRKILMVPLLGLAVLASCQSSKQEITINGELTGFESDSVEISYIAVTDLKNGHVHTDTLPLQDGRFTYKMKNDTVPIQISLFDLSRKTSFRSLLKKIDVIAYPGQTLTVKGSVDDYVVEGSEFHAAYDVLRRELKPYNDKAIDTLSDLLEVYTSKNLPDTLPAFPMGMTESAKKAHEIMFDYVRQHRDEDLSVYLLMALNKPEFLDSLSDKAKNGGMSSLYRAMKKEADDRKAREEASNTLREGMEAPDFTLKDLQGKDLSLSSLRGKYVVLDFWGSWCGWCIKGFPEMKKYYEKYKDRMEILGIDCNDTEEKWRAAVEKNGLSWLHVRNADDRDVTILYGIQGFPTKIVVDPEGKILRVVVGEDPAFYKYLDELFGK